MNDMDYDRELDAIEAQFSDEWDRGEEPTLADYIAKYPQYEDELTDFVLTFAVLETATEDTPDNAAPSEAAQELMKQLLAADRSTAQMLNQRLSELGTTPAEFAKELDLPTYIIGEMQARRLTYLPKKLLAALARRFHQAVEAVENLVAYRPSTGDLALQLRATGSGAAGGLRVRTFREAMLLCLDKGQATEHQVKKWLEEDE